MRELEKPTHSARTDPTMKATTMDSYDGGERMVDTGSLGQRKKKSNEKRFSCISLLRRVALAHISLLFFYLFFSRREPGVRLSWAGFGLNRDFTAKDQPEAINNFHSLCAYYPLSPTSLTDALCARTI